MNRVALLEVSTGVYLKVDYREEHYHGTDDDGLVPCQLLRVYVRKDVLKDTEGGYGADQGVR